MKLQWNIKKINRKTEYNKQAIQSEDNKDSVNDAKVISKAPVLVYFPNVDLSDCKVAQLSRAAMDFIIV